MIEFSSGILVGIIIFYLFLIYRNYKRRQKKGKRFQEYRNAPTSRKLTDTLRHIVFEYNIKRKNNHFSLNVYVEGELRLQVLHRCHFPDLCKSEEDVDFGLALYIPIKRLNQSQKDQLLTIFKEESEVFYYEEVPFDYYVVDIGKLIRYGGYLINRILKEVYHNADVQSLSFELFSEGKLPYIGLSDHPEKS